MKWRHRNNYKKFVNVYKVVDDYSGFNKYDKDVYVNFRGFVGTWDNIDPKHPTEYTNIKWPIDQPIPYARPDGEDIFIILQPVPQQALWGQIKNPWDYNFAGPWGNYLGYVSNDPDQYMDPD
jgi:hypothetical protein